LPVLKGSHREWDPAAVDGRPASPALPAWIRALLRVPLFYKILIANALIVIAGAIAGTATTAQFVRAAPTRSTLELVGLLTAAGVVVSVLVNAVILRLALSPLNLLAETATRVQDGELDARAPYSMLADRDLTHLTWTFNGMLESLALYRKQLREIAARALRAEEEERKRIARELHDETAQTLAALLIRLRLARGAENAEARDAMLDDVRREIAEALEGVRRFARGLRPPALDELGLVPAIESYARMLEEASSIPVSIEAEPVAKLLSPEAELVLYRVVQEALSNAVRHAAAKHITVRIRRSRGNVVAIVEDDGRGFPVEEVLAGPAAGLGLFGMKERTAYMGGRLEIHSEVGKGTRVIAEVPYSPAPAPH
jgi:two-component system sensor histidine kinase UhpB